jgi:carboxypeptidase Taq
MEAKLHGLKTRLLEVDDLNRAAAVLSWDQSTYMPPGGAAARGRQMATLAQIAHHKFTDPAVGRLLDDLRSWAEAQSADADDAALVRVAQRDYDRAVKVPGALIAELYTHAAASYQAWTVARPANDFATMQPMYEKTLDLSRRIAECFPGYAHLADPLIEEGDYGMTTATIKTLFADLRAQLVPIVEAITAQPPLDDACVFQQFGEREQEAFGLEVITRLGYDFERGRQDRTHHPFMTTFSLGDVRITTRFQERDLRDGLFSTIHEAGHAMYEQGIDMRFDGTPLAHGTSNGVHESQSRLWENLVGRSRAFWQHWYPQLQAVFPQQLGAIDADSFYRAINKVQRSLIRVDADEVTYNLHVIMRFDFELDLLDGKLAVRDLPEAWRARMTSDLGITPPNDRDGCLQDVHWTSVIGGSFQGYTIGNILSAQLYDAALAAHPSITDEMRQGEFGTLHGWLREHIYQHGRKYDAAQLVERATGQPMTIEPYIRYLRTKYGELYNLA